MSQITDILYEDALKYLEQLPREELISVVQEHRTVARTLAASQLVKQMKGEGE